VLLLMLHIIVTLLLFELLHGLSSSSTSTHDVMIVDRDDQMIYDQRCADYVGGGRRLNRSGHSLCNVGLCSLS